MKLSLPPKSLLLPCPVLIIGTYGSDGTYYSVGGKLGNSFSVGNELKKR